MKTISDTSATWRSTATVSCVPRVTDYGRADGSYTPRTDLNQTPQTVFDRLKDEGIEVPEEDRYYP